MAETKTYERCSFYFTNGEAQSFDLKAGDVIHTFPESVVLSGTELNGHPWSVEVQRANVCYWRKQTISYIEYTEAEMQVKMAALREAAATRDGEFR